MTYVAATHRYQEMLYRRAGRSGLLLPALSLGLWQYFGAERDTSDAMRLIGTAFDAGITHFDLANNYGPPPGAAEEMFGQLLQTELSSHRDEIIVATKAGHEMWPGPYGNLGSRKSLVASIDQSLRRLQLDYVDIFYSHRPDPDTPLEETMSALADIVRSGKALYAGVSSYGCDRTRQAQRTLAERDTPLLVHQPSYSLVNRWIEEDGTLGACAELGIGIVAYGVLGHGVLSGSHAAGHVATSRQVPDHHRQARVFAAVEKLRSVAERRKQTLPQLALTWVLRRPEVTSAVVGVRSIEQLQQNLQVLHAEPLSPDDLSEIDAAVTDGLIDRRPRS